MTEQTSTHGPAPILHHLSSSQSMRILWALEELSIAHGQPYSIKYYVRDGGRAPTEMQKIFPLGKAPILEIKGTDNFRPQNTTITDDGKDEKRSVITESRVILQYLSDHYSRGIWQPLAEDRDRDVWFQEFANSTLLAVVDRILYFDIIPPAAPWLVRPLLWAVFGPIIRLFRDDVTAPFTLMEAALSEEKPWFSGNKMGLADLNMMWPVDLASARKYFQPEKYPKVTEWLNRIHDREAYEQARAKGGSYDLVRFDMK